VSEHPVPESSVPESSVSEPAGEGSATAGGPVLARSPIAPAAPVRVEAGWEVSGCRSDAALTVTDCTPLAKVAVRAPWNGALAKALGVPFGRASRDGGVQDAAGQDAAGQDAAGQDAAGQDAAGQPWLVAGSGPGEWLVLAPAGTAARVASRLAALAAESAPEEFVSVVDLTHGRALLRITGPDAAELLARLCPVDLDDDMTPDGTALRGPVAGLATDIIRDDRGGTASYLVHCERSSGQYLFGALTAAGESLGIAVDGFRAPGI
jgi:heterotetrameric sarcosine oxidase gamma subunit